MTQPRLFAEPPRPEPLLLEKTDRKGRNVQIHLTIDNQLRVTADARHYRTEDADQSLRRIEAGERTQPSHVIIGDIVLTPAEAQSLSFHFREQTKE